MEFVMGIVGIHFLNLPFPYISCSFALSISGLPRGWPFVEANTSRLGTGNFNSIDSYELVYTEHLQRFRCLFRWQHCLSSMKNKNSPKYRLYYY